MVLQPSDATHSQAMDFMLHLFNQGSRIGILRVVRSALSAFLPQVNGQTFGKSPEVSRVLRGMFKLRPQFPRYTCTYDPDIVLNHYDSLPENRFLLLEELTKKLTVLLALLHATRTQTLQHINVDYIHFNKENNYVCIYIPSILKSTTRLLELGIYIFVFW